MTAFEHVVLEVTEACPHACLHCYNFFRDHRAKVLAPETLNRTQVRRLVRKVKQDAPLKHVGISGGEPLLRRDLPGIVTDLFDDDLGVVVITSGALLTPKRAGQFPKETLFEITLFSADADLHDRIAGCAGAFRRVIDGAIAAWKRGCRLAVTVVVSRLNAHDVGRTLELAIALGARSFLLNRVNFTQLILPKAEQLAPTTDDLQHALDAAERFATKFNTVVSVSVPMPPCIVDLTGYRRLLLGWCARGGAGSYYTISHRGYLRPCNHSSVILGDLKKQSFAELVQSRKAVAYWKPVPKACLDCKHLDHELCRGGCPAASDECYGTRCRWDPIVDILGGPKPVPSRRAHSSASKRLHQAG
jgi:radical SAM protein with 4Fe4S-binding SPASM domain